MELEESCRCCVYLASNNRVFELNVKSGSLRLILKLEEPVYFTSILAKDRKLLLSTVNNRLYLWTPPHAANPSDQRPPAHNDSAIKEVSAPLRYKFAQLATLKGLAASRNGLLLAAVGSPAQKQKFPSTNIVFCADLKKAPRVEEVLLKLMRSLKARLYRDHLLKEPLNLDDFLCLISANHKAFVELVDLMKGLLEEQNGLPGLGLAKARKVPAARQGLLSLRKTLEETLPDRKPSASCWAGSSSRCSRCTGRTSGSSSRTRSTISWPQAIGGCWPRGSRRRSAGPASR